MASENPYQYHSDTALLNERRVMKVRLEGARRQAKHSQAGKDMVDEILRNAAFVEEQIIQRGLDEHPPQMTLPI